MATAPFTSVLQHLRTMAKPTEDSSDQELVQRYAETADPTAFAALVRRHGPLVHGVCRRVLGAGPDLDDVFQATFVVLLKKVASIRKQASVASWLYGVAYRLAIDLKSQRRRRQARADLQSVAENQAMHNDPSRCASLRELTAVLDEELQRLPAWARAAVVTCHLEGMSYTEAAEHLGWRLGTLKTRLGRARNLLRQRLLRRGVTLSLLGLCMALSERAQAAVPAVLMQATLRCVSPKAVPASVAVLAEGAAHALTVGKVKGVVLALCAVCLLGLAGGALAWQASPDESTGGSATVVQEQQAKEPVQQQQPDANVKSKEQADVSAEDEQRFRATLKITDKALLDFFRDLTVSDVDMTRINHLIQQLDAPAFKERDQATAALIAEGQRAVPLLKKAEAKATLELRMRLEKCVKSIGKADGETMAAAARLIKNRRPEGGIQVLMDFIPFVLDDAEEDVLDALCGLAFSGGKVHPQGLAALKDSVPARRAAAAVLVGGFGTLQQRAAVEPLLKDVDSGVRFRAAQGLMAARDRRAIPALIDMLVTSDLPWAQRAEDLLQELADKTAPAAALGETGSGRDRCQTAWTAWWREHQERLQWPAAGLQLVNKESLARKAVVDFINAIINRDRALLERSTDLPFFNGDKTFTMPEEFNAFLEGGDLMGKVTFRVLRVISIAEQAKATPHSEAERAYLAKVARPGTLSVHVAIDEAKQNRAEFVGLIVRVNSGRGRVIGIVMIKEE
jgi:RNA polymerase sigma factor (sigma-70 family)